jgi:hypothetical protein
MACLFACCVSSGIASDATVIEKIGNVTVICLYGVRYASGTLTPLLGIDGWPLPCKEWSPEACEGQLLECQTNCMADRVALGELETCAGYDAFVESCLDAEGMRDER